MIGIEEVCDHCRWRRKTTRFGRRSGVALDLCGECLARELERHDLEGRVDGLRMRAEAQSRQYRVVEEENDRLRAKLAEVAEIFREHPGERQLADRIWSRFAEAAAISGEEEAR